MRKFRLIALPAILLISGCYRGYLNHLQMKNIVDMSSNYCNVRKLQNCEQYRLCVAKSYDKVRNKFYAGASNTTSYILLYSLSEYEGKEYANLINNTYELLNEDFRKLNNPSVSTSISYFIYTHNSCANITGDRTYNINSFMPLLRKEYGVK